MCIKSGYIFYWYGVISFTMDNHLIHFHLALQHKLSQVDIYLYKASPSLVTYLVQGMKLLCCTAHVQEESVDLGHMWMLLAKWVSIIVLFNSPCQFNIYAMKPLSFCHCRIVSLVGYLWCLSMGMLSVSAFSILQSTGIVTVVKKLQLKVFLLSSSKLMVCCLSFGSFFFHKVSTSYMCRGQLYVFITLIKVHLALWNASVKLAIHGHLNGASWLSGSHHLF